jgi:tetratricopeptide (TPR) repeat protein
LGSITAPGQRRSANNPGRLVQTDARSDIYSLGATMYHLLTNQEPEPIQTPTPGSVLAKNPRLRTIQVNGRAICPVEQVIIKAMQQDPALRFQNAEAMRMALAQCLPAGSVVAPATIQMAAISPNATLVVPAQSPATSTSDVICPRCKYVNRPGAKFCKRDGQPLTQGATVVPPQANRQVPLRAQPVRSSGIQSRPVTRQSIQARPVSRPGPIQARPAQQPSTLSPYRQGLQLLNDKKYPESIAQFKLAQVPGHPSYEVAYGLGRAYRQYAYSVRLTQPDVWKEQLRLAIEQFEQAVKLKPDAVDAQFQLGLSYSDLELYDKASNAFQQVQKLTPRDSAVYLQLGRVAMEQGYMIEAEAYLQEGLQVQPNHTLILVTLGKLYLKMSQSSATAKAINVLRQATQLEPTLWEGWYELGRAHMKAREWKVALSALEQARQANADADEIYSAMATCYLKTGKKAEARDMVRQSLLINPGNAEATRLQKQV